VTRRTQRHSPNIPGVAHSTFSRSCSSSSEAVQLGHSQPLHKKWRTHMTAATPCLSFRRRRRSNGRPRRPLRLRRRSPPRTVRHLLRPSDSCLKLRTGPRSHPTFRCILVLFYPAPSDKNNQQPHSTLFPTLPGLFPTLRGHLFPDWLLIPYHCTRTPCRILHPLSESPARPLVPCLLYHRRRAAHRCNLTTAARTLTAQARSRRSSSVTSRTRT